jgi:hypothetical protein
MTVLAIYPPPPPRRPETEYVPRHTPGEGRTPVEWHLTMPGPYPTHTAGEGRTPAPWIVTGLANARALRAADANEERLRQALIRGYTKQLDQIGE